MLRTLMLSLAVIGAAATSFAPDGGGGGRAATATTKWYVLKKKLLGHEAGEKIEMEEADAVPLLASKAVELCDDDPSSDVADTIVQGVTKKIGDIVDAAVEQAIKNLKAAKKGQVSIQVKDNANEDNSFGFEMFGDLLRDVKSHSHRENPRTSDRLKKLLSWQNNEETRSKAANSDDPMNTQSGEDGGILIPPNFSNTLYRKVFDDSDVLGQLDTYNIGGNSIVFPRLREDSRATGSRYGGVRVYWTAEGNNVTGTRPKFDRLALSLKKLMALVFVTQEQLDDSGLALEQLLMNVVASEINFVLCDAIFNGDGVGKPLGILNAPCKWSEPKETSQTATTVNANNISKMWSRCQARLRQRANWYINQDVEPMLDLLSLAIGTGGSTVPMYLQPGGLTGTSPGMLKGRPVKPVEFCPTLGTEGDIILFDPGSYCFVTKGGIKTAMSMHLRFDYDEQVFKFTYRCDGAPWWPKALTPYKGTNKLSPIVTVATRA